MIETDIWRAAHTMIQMYELDAGWRAGLRADQLYEEGDVDGFHIWARIARAINQLQDVEPRFNDVRH
jgi:hypothetical protein